MRTSSSEAGTKSMESEFSPPMFKPPCSMEFASLSGDAWYQLGIRCQLLRLQGLRASGKPLNIGCNVRAQLHLTAPIYRKVVPRIRRRHPRSSGGVANRKILTSVHESNRQ